MTLLTIASKYLIPERAVMPVSFKKLSSLTVLVDEFPLL